MSKAKQQTCPICGSGQPLSSHTCSICGARLSGKPTPVLKKPDSDSESPLLYDPSLGEDDLLVASVSRRILITGGILVMGCLLAMCLAAILLLTQTLTDSDFPLSKSDSDAQPTEEKSPTPISVIAPSWSTSTINPTVAGIFPPSQVTPASGLPTVAAIGAPGTTASLPPTNTGIPPTFPTVTPLPPTPTIEPTQGPCVYTVGEGDTLYGLALQCGHLQLSIVDVIVRENNLACDTCISIGQEITIPRPTPTFDPASSSVEHADSVVNAALVAESEDEAEAGKKAGSPGIATLNPEATDDIFATLAVRSEPTLDPNLMYHIVQTGQTLIDVIALYDIDAKLLSEINPEMEFPQCDFGERFGGPTCLVYLYEGQKVRVPAPTRTPTIPPTSDGSETPTPSPTATINVPALFSPAEGSRFDAASLITLRWTTTGTLDMDEVYVVHITNLDTGEQFTGTSRDLSFVLPVDWQPSTDKYQPFEWTVSVAVFIDGGLADEHFQTSPRHFEWQGKN